MSTATQALGTERKVPSGPALKVWAYEVARENGKQGFAVNMPAGARVLRVEKVREKSGQVMPKLFALVNPAMREEPRYFVMGKTNHPLPTKEECTEAIGRQGVEALHYAGSFEEGSDWVHVFEIRMKTLREPGEEQ